MEKVIIVRYCEIHLKGKNRGYFEKVFMNNLEKALTPFYTTLPEEERSGMGFTIMQTFMSQFSVQSERGKGTRVAMSKDFGARGSDAR